MTVFQKVLLFAAAPIWSAYGQPKVRPVEALINTQDPGWRVVREWISAAKRPVEVLAVDPVRARKALFKTQVTSRSPMGAIILETGGILVDHGWIRILGSGSTRMSRTIPGWNKGKSFQQDGERPSFLLVADDVLGGFFALNGGRFGKDEGAVYYLAPDSLDWRALDMGYSDFLVFCFSGDLEGFYKGFRWKDWEKDVRSLLC